MVKGKRLHAFCHTGHRRTTGSDAKNEVPRQPGEVLIQSSELRSFDEPPKVFASSAEQQSPFRSALPPSSAGPPRQDAPCEPNVSGSDACALIRSSSKAKKPRFAVRFEDIAGPQISWDSMK